MMHNYVHIQLNENAEAQAEKVKSDLRCLLHYSNQGSVSKSNVFIIIKQDLKP